MSIYDPDLLAQSIYDSRRQGAHPTSDEDWERFKERSPTFYQVLLEDANRMIESGELDD